MQGHSKFWGTHRFQSSLLACGQVRSAASETESAAAAGGSGGRVEVLPVQWRKGLNLGVREFTTPLPLLLPLLGPCCCQPLVGIDLRD